MTLYELNQAGYTGLPKMAKSAIEKKRCDITEWLDDILPYYDMEQDIYFMLLNNERHYYTIFTWKEGESYDLASEIISVVKDLGTLKSIELNNDNAWEFWITHPDTTTQAYYLFDYTKGVIEV